MKSRSCDGLAAKGLFVQEETYLTALFVHTTALVVWELVPVGSEILLTVPVADVEILAVAAQVPFAFVRLPHWLLVHGGSYQHSANNGKNKILKLQSKKWQLCNWKIDQWTYVNWHFSPQYNQKEAKLRRNGELPITPKLILFLWLGWKYEKIVRK